MLKNYQKEAKSKKKNVKKAVVTRESSPDWELWEASCDIYDRLWYQ